MIYNNNNSNYKHNTILYNTIKLYPMRYESTAIENE